MTTTQENHQHHARVCGNEVTFFDRKARRLEDGDWEIVGPVGPKIFTPDSNAGNWLHQFLTSRNEENLFIWANAHGGRILWLEGVISDEDVVNAQSAAINDGSHYVQCVVMSDVEMDIAGKTVSISVVVSDRDINEKLSVAELAEGSSPDSIKVAKEHRCTADI